MESHIPKRKDTKETLIKFMLIVSTYAVFGGFRIAQFFVFYVVYYVLLFVFWSFRLASLSVPLVHYLLRLSLSNIPPCLQKRHYTLVCSHMDWPRLHIQNSEHLQKNVSHDNAMNSIFSLKHIYIKKKKQYYIVLVLVLWDN